jgi:Flp pilus assembly pilin Flp
MIEYVLLLALIAVVAITAVALLGTNASTEFDCVAKSVGTEKNAC